MVPDTEKLIQLLVASVALALGAVAGYIAKHMRDRRGAPPHGELTEKNRDWIDGRIAHKINNAIQISVEPVGRDHKALRADFDLHEKEFNVLSDRIIEHIAHDDIREEHVVRDLDAIKADIERIRSITNGEVVKIATQMAQVLRFMERQEASREGREEERKRNGERRR